MQATAQSTQRRLLFARFWQVASGFWTGQRRREAWFLTLTLLAVILGQLYVQFRLNVWNRDLFDALEQKDIAKVGWLALFFVPLAVSAVALTVASVWGRLTSQRAWRAWLTDYQIDRWLRNGRYYQLNFIHGEHQNPEFRIADDTRIATESPIDFAFGVTTAVLTAITFTGVLWAVGGALSFELNGSTIRIPGYLVFVAIIYSAITTTAMVIIGRRFVEVAEGKNQVRSRIPLRRNAAAREWREHCPPRWRTGGAQRPWRGARAGDRPMAADVRAVPANDGRLLRQLRPRARRADHPVRAQVSRRDHEPRRGHAGLDRLRDRSAILQLAGRELSQARGLDGVRQPRRGPDRLPRPARACRAARSRTHPSYRDGAGGRTPAAERLGQSRRRDCRRG